MTQVTVQFRSPLLRASLAVLFLGVALAGCITAPEALRGAPEAELGVDGDRHWAGSPVAFDVASSHDPNGRIESYVIDFGDGTTEEFTDEQLEKIEHTYEAGGVYEVVLTVQDDGQDQDGPMNATDRQTLKVLERIDVETGLIVASPEGGEGVERRNVSVPTRENVSGIEVDLSVDSALLVGTTDVTVRILNGTGSVLAEENVSVDAGQGERAHLFAPIGEVDEYELEIHTRSGAAHANGTVTVYYGSIETVTPEPEEETEGENDTAHPEDRET